LTLAIDQVKVLVRLNVTDHKAGGLKLNTFDEGVEELQKLLETTFQIWLMGAGASYASNIPLMHDLTTRVSGLVDAPNCKLLSTIRTELPENAHIEHVLSHLGDFIALAKRNSSNRITLGGNEFDLAALESLHSEIIRHIAETVRYGYRPAAEGIAESIGAIGTPIVEIKHHRKFMSALFSGRSNLESRSRVVFATTNYDTLIEDALTISKRSVFDGFSPGGIGFWTGHSSDLLENLPPRTHQVIKLHGSVDWLRSDGGAVVRARYGTAYLANLENTLIYPQATKYVETQRDPFADLFLAFRRNLGAHDSHVLCIVGYSFGDEHINLEIEEAMRRAGSKTNIVAFSRELPAAGTTKLPATLQSWLADSFAARVYVASDKALYAGGKRLTRSLPEDMTWWTFSGLSQFLESGVVA
jgi:hypothetical protein